MSASPSSAGHGPPSSPFAGTDPTLYSPETVRKVVKGGRAHLPIVESSVANGKKPVKSITKVVIKGIEYNGLHPQPHRLGTFIDELAKNDPDFISRFLFVTRISDGTVAGQDHEMEQYHIQHQMKLYQVFAWCVPVYSRGVHLRFDNLRDTCEAKQLLEARGFELCFIDNYDFAVAKSQDTGAIDEFEGQVKVVILVEPVQKHPALVFSQNNLVWLTESIENAMAAFGSVRTYVHTKTDDQKMLFTFRVEYHSAEAATRAVASLKKDPMWDMSENKLWRWSTVDVANWVGPRAPNSPHRRMPRIDDQGRIVGFRPLPQHNINLGRRHPADAHNRVRRERINDGTDVRTTIMLRNIPNKLDWLSLKALLDQVCFGTYDFVYLRIDFKTGFNVGYAFINFSDVSGMIAMLDKVEHRGWIGYRSNKNAEISYATIQGREALVQKFRNSSVMQETPFCRPRLFTPYNDAIVMNELRIAGFEQPFPAPDNLSKLQRSMDSARSIGLFPPSGITNNGQRTTVSGWDRGNPRDVGHNAYTSVQQNASRTIPGMTEHMKRECEQYNACTHGPSQYGAMIPFDYLPPSVVYEFMRRYGNTTRVHIADPGVIGRPLANHAAGPQLFNAGAAPVFAGRYGQAFQAHTNGGQTSSAATAGPSTSSRAFASAGRVLGDWGGMRMGESYNIGEY